METEPTKQTKKLYLVEGSFKVITYFTAYVLADDEDEASDIASEIDCVDAGCDTRNVVGFCEQDSECFPENLDHCEEIKDRDVPKFVRTLQYNKHPDLPK